MSYFRSYFEKNNTIIKNSQVNTAKNPATEIFYGTSFSKFIFKIDFSELQDRIIRGYYVIDDNTKHYLKLTNTIFGDESFLGAKKSESKERTTSFDLIVFRVPEDWDEGVGFDNEYVGYDLSMGNLTYDRRPSNWYYRTTLNTWTSEGIYTTNPNIIQTIHFDQGNENIDVDITSYVNDILVSGTTDYGLGIAFSVAYQDVNSDVDRSVSFFSKYTQTFFEPFVESVFDDVVDDNRYNFIENQIQNLYLYVTKGTNFYDLDYDPVVDIYDNTNTPISGLTGLTATKVKLGVYKISFGLTGFICDGKRFFYDNWSNLSLDGVNVSDVKQKFIPKQYNVLYGLGENPTELNRYVFQFFGVKLNEKIKRGEIRKVVVNLRSINQTKPQVFNDIYYRMFIKEGHTDVQVHDWTKLDSTNENSFFLDTSIYIPREYFIEIKSKTHSEEILHNELIKFEIVSEK